MDFAIEDFIIRQYISSQNPQKIMDRFISQVEVQRLFGTAWIKCWLAKNYVTVLFL